jgi:HEAT repeat protein
MAVMKRRQVVVLILGLAAAGVVVGFFFLPPVRARVLEEWYLLKLGSKDPIERRIAGERLAGVRSIRAVPRIAALFPADKEDGPRWIPRALVRIGPEGIRAALGLQDKKGLIHGEVFEAIEDLGPEGWEAIPALIGLLDSEANRYPVAKALAGIGLEAIPSLIEVLARGGDEAKQTVVGILGGIRDARAVPALIGALGDPSLKRIAAEALGDIGPDAREAVPALAAVLSDENESVRQAACDALGKIGPDAREAMPALVEAFARKRLTKACPRFSEIDPEGKIATPIFLRNLESLPRDDNNFTASFFEALSMYAGASEEVRKALLAKTRDEDPVFRQNAARVLESTKTEETAGRLRELLADPVREVRFEAAFALADKFFPDEAIPVFLEALRNPGAKYTTVDQIRNLGLRAEPLIPALIAELKHPHDHIPDNVSGTLTALKALLPKHLPALTELLGDADIRVRRRAVMVIQEIGPQAAPAVPALIEALRSSDRMLQDAAAGALFAIGPGAKDAVPALFEWNAGLNTNLALHILERIGEAAVPGAIEALRDPTLKVRSGAADLLGRIGARPDLVVPALLRTLGDPEPDVRRAATGSLHKFGEISGEIRSTLTAIASGDPDPFVRIEAASALAVSTKDPSEASRLLKPLLDHDEPGVRLSAATALWFASGEAEAVLPVLIAILDHPRSRWDACQDLGSMGPAAAPAVPALTRFLKDDNPNVVWAVAESLGKIGKGARPALPALREAMALEGADMKEMIGEAIAAIEAAN